MTETKSKKIQVLHWRLHEVEPPEGKSPEMPEWKYSAPAHEEVDTVVPFSHTMTSIGQGDARYHFTYTNQDGVPPLRSVTALLGIHEFVVYGETILYCTEYDGKTGVETVRSLADSDVEYLFGEASGKFCSGCYQSAARPPPLKFRSWDDFERYSATGLCPQCC